MRALFPYYLVKRAWHISIQSGGHTTYGRSSVATTTVATSTPIQK